MLSHPEVSAFDTESAIERLKMLRHLIILRECMFQQGQDYRQQSEEIARLTASLVAWNTAAEAQMKSEGTALEKIRAHLTQASMLAIELHGETPAAGRLVEELMAASITVMKLEGETEGAGVC